MLITMRKLLPLFVLACFAGLLVPARSANALDNPALGTPEPSLKIKASEDSGKCKKKPCCAEKPCECEGTGSPVTAEFGTLKLTFVDLEYNIGDIDFDIVRAYISDDAYVGHFGRGMTSSLDHASLSTVNGEVDYEMVVVRYPAGQRSSFVRQPDNSYAGPTGETDTLTLNGDEFELADRHGNLSVFDKETGWLLRKISSNGRVISFDHSDNGQLRSIELAPGLFILITYGPNGFVESIADFSGREVSYEYDEFGNLTYFTDAEEHQWEYTYGVEGLLAGVISPLFEETVSVEYDDQLRVHTMVNIDGDYTYSYHDGYMVRRDNALSTLLDTEVTQRYDYDALGVITKIADPIGNEQVYTYDGLYQLIQYADLLDRTTAYEYDDRGRVTKTTFPDLTTRFFTYHPVFDYKTSETDENGVTTAWAYDSVGNLTQETRALGTDVEQTRIWEYDSLGRLTRQVEPVDRETLMGYDDLGRMTSFDPPGEMLIHYEYDLLGNRTRAIGQGGEVIEYEYDRLSRHVGTTVADEPQARVTYDAAGRKVSVFEPGLGYETFGYDSVGHLTSQANYQNESATWDYVGPYVTTRTDERGLQVHYVYNERGNLVEKRNPSPAGESVWAYQYDDMGALTSEGAQTGLSETKTRDLRGRVKTVSRSDGTMETYDYDPAGNLLRKVDFSGHVWQMEYDELNRVTARKENGELVMRVVFNDMGEVWQEVLPRGTRYYDYDPNSGRLTRMTDADGYPIDYELTGLDRLTAIVRADGRRTSFSHDSSGRARRITTPGGRVTDISYIGGTEPSSFTENGAFVTRFDYDAANRLSQVTLPDETSTYGFEYDAAGRGTKRILPDGTEITAEHDDADMITSVGYPDGSETSFSYTDGGMISSMSNDHGSHDLEYDTLGRLTSFTYQGRTMQYSYPDNQTIVMEYPSGLVLTRRLDTKGRTSEIQIDGDASPAAAYEFTPDGMIESIEYGSGVRADYTQSGEGFVHELVYSRGEETVRGWRRGTDDLNHTMWVECLDDSTKSFAVERDDDDRLISKLTGVLEADHTVPSPLHSEAFDLDGLGNWLSYTRDGSIETRTHSRDHRINRRTIDGTSVELQYNANGDLVSDGQRNYIYGYDSELQEVRLVEDDSLVEKYTYDPMGNLMKVETGSGDVYEFVRDHWHVIEVYKNDTLIKTNVYGGTMDEHVCSIINGTRYYYIGDTGLNVSAVTDDTGVVVESYEYSAYGIPSFFDGAGNPISGSAIGNDWLHKGRLYSEATGNYYYRARFLSPEMGRFLVRDPLAIAGDYSANLYEYVGGTPLDSRDVWGLCKGCIDGGLSVNLLAGPVVDSFKDRFGIGIDFKFSVDGTQCRKCCSKYRYDCGMVSNGSVSISGSASYSYEIPATKLPGLAGRIAAAWKLLGGKVGITLKASASAGGSISFDTDTCVGKQTKEGCLSGKGSISATGGITSPSILGCSGSANVYGSLSAEVKCCTGKDAGDKGGCTVCAQGKIGVKGELKCEVKILKLITVSFSKKMDCTLLSWAEGCSSGNNGCFVTDSEPDQCPDDPFKIVPGECGCGLLDEDTDGDGTYNCKDDCPFDSEKTSPGRCGCGMSDSFLACDDGRFCNGFEQCDGGGGCISTGPGCPIGKICLEETNECVDCQNGWDCPASTDPCEMAVCIEGACQLVEIPHCNDECQYPSDCSTPNACYVADCVAGHCTFSRISCSDSGNDCLSTSCDPAVGCVNSPRDGVSCDDGNECTASDYCDGGFCMPGQSITCQAHGPCDNAYCDPASGCVHDGSYYNGNSCDDGNACTQGDECLSGSCQSGSFIECPEVESDCAYYYCDGAVGCTYVALQRGAPCDDGEACTIGDTCDGSGNCQGGEWKTCFSGRYCSGTGSCEDGNCIYDGDPCEGSGLYCDEVLDRCVSCLFDVHCDDENSCTTDVCNDEGSCDNIDLVCDDGLFCTGEGVCVGGLCEYDGDPCLGEGLYCDEHGDRCVECLSPAHCDDGDENTTDACNTVTGECEYY